MHLHRTDPEDLVGLLSLDDVDRLLTESAIRAPAVRVAQDGQVLASSRFTRAATLAGEPLTGLVDARKARVAAKPSSTGICTSISTSA